MHVVDNCLTLGYSLVPSPVKKDPWNNWEPCSSQAITGRSPRDLGGWFEESS